MSVPSKSGPLKSGLLKSGLLKSWPFEILYIVTCSGPVLEVGRSQIDL